MGVGGWCGCVCGGVVWMCVCVCGCGCVCGCVCVCGGELLTVMESSPFQPSVQVPPGSDYHREWMAYRDKLKTALDCFQASDIQARVE